MVSLCKISLVMIVLLLFPLVFASSPEYSVSHLLDDEVVNGVVDLGDLLFIGEQYTSELFVLSDIEALTLQQFDTLRWVGNGSVKIVSPTFQDTILVFGSEYYFSSFGGYTIESMINSSVFDFIVCVGADLNVINVSAGVVPIGFDLSFSDDSFILDEEETIAVTLVVDDDVVPDEYDIIYKINNVSFTKSVEVIENINWSMNIDDLDSVVEIKSGQGMYLGRIDLENVGNTDVEISISKTGNSTHLVGIPQPQTMYRKNSLSIDIQAQVPSVQSSGEYVIDLEVSGGGKSENVSIIINVVDVILPVIESINFSTDKVFMDNAIVVVATDNTDVIGLTMGYDGQVIELDKDGNVFTTNVQFNKLSRYVFDFCALDEDDNEVCQVVNKTFEKQPVISDVVSVVSLPAMKVGKYASFDVFNITTAIGEGVTIKLVSLDLPTTNNATEPIIRFVDESGSVKAFTKYEEEIKLFGTGVITLEVRADFVSDFTGVLRIVMPEQYESVQDITFTASFKDYDVPQDFSTQWVGGRDLSCRVVDTGDLLTSKYICELEFPIDTNPDDISVPTTVSERNGFKNEADVVRAELKKSRASSAWVISILIVIVIVILLWGLFMVFWQPCIRLKTGKTKNYNEVK